MLPERKGSLQQRGVRERLRVVAEVPVAGGVHFLAIEPTRAGECDELAEQLVGFARSSGDGEAQSMSAGGQHAVSPRSGTTSR